MAVNESRNMSSEFMQGTVDSTYMMLVPDRGGVVENPNIERLGWPIYKQAEQHMTFPKAAG